MRSSFIPKGYQPHLTLYQTQSAISLIKRVFQDSLAHALHLERVSAPPVIVLCTVHLGECAIHKTFCRSFIYIIESLCRGSVIIVHRQNQFMNGNVCRFFGIFRVFKKMKY